ncbi:MAG: 30S ribosomal protein S12 methylthiotransferase RimO [Candidatus Acididesulfobacter guangdongensis]|uniref:Ribosomal protein uS12 methylthiotransferase RimO n=1 Tax=Acididesulfobacter guangdongensis TaxID=2597225 RepID=A0A519BHS7_ACIG2|nr:MAG: 30S ribosomal protein S12 methylthiotransferase RimO [Candidatus Acididesulfobacter guangdongensis]
MKNLKFHLISLGCPKNQVDSEDMFTILKREGLIFSPEVSGSDICIINTCGFLEKARKESIDIIVETINHKLEGSTKHIIVTGCMVNNNKDVLIKDLPEVDYFLSTFDETAIADIAKKLNENENENENENASSEISLNTNITTNTGSNIIANTNTNINININTNTNINININAATDSKFIEREHFNLKRTAYLKISEGCSRHCSFCVIPAIRGVYKSKSIEDLKKEALYLSENGVKELIIISQDITYYGVDCNIKDGLYILLKELIKVKKIKWIRLMYLYPALITDNLISLIKNEEKILKYVDMPVQHISDNILKLMKRSTDKKAILRLIEKFKTEIPDIALRTSLICGFPGETEDDFNELLFFVKETKFDNLGVFKYSDELDAASFKLKNKIGVKSKNERYKTLMELQNSLLPEIFAKYNGKQYEAIIDNENSGKNIIRTRTYFQAPDIDGCTYIYSENKGGITGEITGGITDYGVIKRSIKKHEGADFLQVKITKQKNYDLYGIDCS